MRCRKKTLESFVTLHVSDKLGLSLCDCMTLIKNDREIVVKGVLDSFDKQQFYPVFCYRVETVVTKVKISVSLLKNLIHGYINKNTSESHNNYRAANWVKLLANVNIKVAYTIVNFIFNDNKDFYDDIFNRNDDTVVELLIYGNNVTTELMINHD